MSEDVLSSDVDTATKLISEAAHPSVDMIFGTSFDENLSDEINITVIATGFEDEVKPIVDTVDNSRVLESVKDAKSSKPGDDFTDLFKIFNGRQ